MKYFLLALVLLLGSATAPAQQSPPASEEGPRQEAPPLEETADQDGDGEEQDIPLDEDSSANPPPPSSRFEPTEQISEDLSVSFPIDI